MTSTYFPKQPPWSLDGAATLLDMAGGIPAFADLGREQLTAAVALQRMLLDHGIAYLADEVGMGKTYVALAVVAMMRHFQPDLRVLYVLPSQNVQAKWHERELPAFIRNQLKPVAMAGRASMDAAACDNVEEWARLEAREGGARDTFLRFSGLSFALSEDPARGRQRVSELADILGIPGGLGNTRDKSSLKQRAALLLNRRLPTYDLVVVDEAHLLKDGGGEHAANRVRFLANALGALGTTGRRRFCGALLMSGTPFDRDLSQLARQMQIFARMQSPQAPHRRVEALAHRRAAGAGWDELHAGLAPYMVRRVQRLKVGLTTLSRNQYRIEHRAEAGISLKHETGPEALQQRLFSALVQKKLVDGIGERLDGRFPLAMFSSWEAYSAAPASGAAPADVDAEGDALDVEHGAQRGDAKAVDTGILANVLAGHEELFGMPPHPKLEHEARRLGRDAFVAGNKQLVFVRRLASIGDLYRRLNDRYDAWLAEYLGRQGLCTREEWARVCHFGEKRASVSAELVPPAYENEEGVTPSAPDEPTATTDTLYSWFFRGKLDARGKRFASRHELEEPRLLRQRLTNMDAWECVIGEIDWRGYLLRRANLALDIGFAELADLAGTIAGPDTRIGRYRRLQQAFLTLASQRLGGPMGSAIGTIRDYYAHHLLRDAARDTTVISKDYAQAVLECPTVALGLALHPGASPAMAHWDAVWESLSGGHDERPGETLADLDLQVEVMFAQLRLDHPFIDLYIATNGGAGKPLSGLAAARSMVLRIVDLCAAGVGTGAFGTARILFDLAEGWPQLAKTNFAALGVHDTGLARQSWRQEIQRLVTPEGPVEWASGEFKANRSAVARRFRMPGYPCVLVATSVLQEGEDLHVFCDRVTHFGISGSPIGIEQKNGRVDRIGSLAQRRLARNPDVASSGIQVWFPHLNESLEWYQIRELCFRLNDYLRSMHSIVPVESGASVRLDQVVSDSTPIPPKLDDALVSPFEPRIEARDGAVGPAEVLALAGAAPRRSLPAALGLPRERRLMDTLAERSFTLRPNLRRDAIAVGVVPRDGAGKGRNWRVGKVVKGAFYVTHAQLAPVATQLVADACLPLLMLATSDGRRKGLRYPGFDTTQCTDEQLRTIVDGLRNALDAGT